MVLAEGGVGKARMEVVVVVVDGKNERAMPLAEAANRVRRGAGVVKVDSVDSGVLSLAWRREGRWRSGEEMLAGEGGGGGGGCVGRLWGGGSGEALLDSPLTLVSLAL